MRAATVLIGVLLLGGSAFAADSQVKIVVAAAEAKQQSPAMRVQPVSMRECSMSQFLAP